MTSALLMMLEDSELSSDWATLPGWFLSAVDDDDDDENHELAGEELDEDEDEDEAEDGGGKAERATLFEAADETIRIAIDSSEGPALRARSSARAAAARDADEVAAAAADLADNFPE